MFINLAKQGDSKWWKYLMGLASILIAFSLGQIPITLYSYYKKKVLEINDEKFTEYLANMNYTELGISENIFLLLLLTTFIFAFCVIIWLLPIIHKRPTLSFVTSRKKFDFRRFLIGFGLWFFLAILITFLLLDSNKYYYNFDLDKFIPLVLIAILLIPIQTAVEEILFRGYLFQGVYQATRNKWISLIIVTLLFAVIHVFNPEFKEGILMIIPAHLIFGFTLGYIVLVDDGLEIPIGLHAGNNIFVAVILSASGAAVTTPSLFKTSIQNLVDILPLLFILLSIISYLSLKFIYNWKASEKNEATQTA